MNSNIDSLTFVFVFISLDLYVSTSFALSESTTK